MKKKKIIVKVQLPIISSESGFALIYNEDRSIMQEVPLRTKKEFKELDKMLGEGRKGYFYGEYQGSGFILLGKAPWQNW